MVTVIAILVYFALLLLFGRMAAGRATNESFFRGERRSRWQMVAFGMIGASVSGVTFVSVPGMVMHTSKAIFQVEVAAPETKKGTRINSYFLYSDTQHAPQA